MFYFQQQITHWEDENIPNIVPEWDMNTIYKTGELIRYENYQYKSTSEDNKENIPTENIGVKWVEWQPANDFAMLNLSNNYPTTWTEASGYVVFRRGAKDYLAIGNFNATSIAIQYLADDNTVVEEQNFTFGNNLSVFDVWTYGYGGFDTTFENIFFQPLKKLGTNIKVLFHSAVGQNISCGFFVSGISAKGGTTLENISLPDRRVGEKSIKVVNFTTVVNDYESSRIVAKAKQNVDVPMMFIVDESSNSMFNHIAVVGKISNVSTNYNNHNKISISWEIEQINY